MLAEQLPCFFACLQFLSDTFTLRRAFFFQFTEELPAHPWCGLFAVEPSGVAKATHVCSSSLTVQSQVVIIHRTLRRGP